MSDAEIEPSQRTPDEVNLMVAATVDTLDQAFAWVVRQVDARGIERPRIEISPVAAMPPEADGAWCHYYDVSVSGTLPPEDPR